MILDERRVRTNDNIQFLYPIADCILSKSEVVLHQDVRKRGEEQNKWSFMPFRQAAQRQTNLVHDALHRKGGLRATPSCQGLGLSLAQKSQACPLTNPPFLPVIYNLLCLLHSHSAVLQNDSHITRSTHASHTN